MVELVAMSGILTTHHSDFADVQEMIARRDRLGVTVSLCIPSLNEQETIGEVVSVLKSALQDRHPLLEEIVVMDSGSSDRTREVAAAAGAKVLLASEVLPDAGPASGKGENIWKAVYALRGDILCFVDGDVRNMHPRFVLGPLGPLLSDPRLKYVKAFYDRPHVAGETARPAGGGRVTEALVRPLFSMFYPELAGFIQPLSGEYSARREVLEALSMPVGYGIEVAHLMDVLHGWGREAMAQCDLEERIHRHQDTAALGRMSFSILQSFLRRAQRDGRLRVSDTPAEIFRYFVEEKDGYYPREAVIRENERPPIRDMPEYRSKFSTHPGEQDSRICA